MSYLREEPAPAPKRPSRQEEVAAMDRAMAIEAEHPEPAKAREVRAPKAPALDAAFRQDVETLVGLAERLYHLPGGKNGNGAVGQCCARVRQRLEGSP